MSRLIIVQIILYIYFKIDGTLLNKASQLIPLQLKKKKSRYFHQHPIIIHPLIINHTTAPPLSCIFPAIQRSTLFYCNGAGGGGVVFAPGGGMNKGRYVTAKAMTTASFVSKSSLQAFFSCFQWISNRMDRKKKKGKNIPDMPTEK